MVVQGHADALLVWFYRGELRISCWLDEAPSLHSWVHPNARESWAEIFPIGQRWNSREHCAIRSLRTKHWEPMFRVRPMHRRCRTTLLSSCSVMATSPNTSSQVSDDSHRFAHLDGLVARCLNADNEGERVNALTRRHAMRVLVASGIGTAVFQRQVAAQVASGAEVSLAMLTEAEWIAGIALSDSEREAVVGALNRMQNDLVELRAMPIDYRVGPAFHFAPRAPEPLPAPSSDLKAATEPLGERAAAGFRRRSRLFTGHCVV